MMDTVQEVSARGQLIGRICRRRLEQTGIGRRMRSVVMSIIAAQREPTTIPVTPYSCIFLPILSATTAVTTPTSTATPCVSSVLGFFNTAP